MNDFAHHLSLGQVRDGDRLDLRADDAERKTIADRLRLLTLARFDAQVTLSRSGETVGAKGRVLAVLEQACVATGDPVPAHIDEAFDISFRPPPSGSPDEEIELSEDECDVAFHDGGEVDLGTALADTLALALDPYPRSAQADDALKEAGVISEEEASPFAALAALKGKIGE